MLSELEPWSFQLKPGFRLRGWKTEFTGKPLICFLHGNGFSGLTYLPFLSKLTKDFDLLITDLPGHGDSDVGYRFSPWNSSAKWALDVVKYFSNQLPESTKVFGLGHSYGGVITGLMAGKDTQLFDKCMLLDPVIFSHKMLKIMKVAGAIGILDKTKLAKTARNRVEHWESRDAAYKELHGRGGFKGWREDALMSYIDYALTDSKSGVSLKCPTSIESKIYSSYPNDLWGYLKKMDVPCKILTAEKSFPFIQQSADKLNTHTHYTTEAVKGGHCFMQEDPDYAAELVRDWFLS
jgi:pimeloyl-ACP methyl ester carboxylesterase